jgi:hypothetical protein
VVTARDAVFKPKGDLMKLTDTIANNIANGSSPLSFLILRNALKRLVGRGSCATAQRFQ